MNIQPLSIITRDGRQRIDLSLTADAPLHASLTVSDGPAKLAGPVPVSCNSGTSTLSVWLPEPAQDHPHAHWQLVADDDHRVIAENDTPWLRPRHTTIYIMLASHTDIGLHNSQYIQRYNASRFLEQAARLIDKTADRQPCDRYRYVCEGTWFWHNFPADRGPEAARDFVRKYVDNGSIGVCCGLAGNVTHTYGLEELCRSTYERQRLADTDAISSHTMTMADHNGLTAALIQPCADAGITNLFFAPNQWNPLPSTVWPCDTSIPGATWNPDAAGGGSRIDVRFHSSLPQLFWWQDRNSSRRLLVWAATHYSRGAWRLGLAADSTPSPAQLARMEKLIGQFLPDFEARYPYNVWLTACYQDDQEPSLGVTDCLRDWNAHFAWPQLRTLGNPDEPFDLVRQNFADAIPTLTGDITAGWCQLANSVADVLPRKYEADRQLPVAERFAAVAALTDSAYRYPATAFQRAWDALLCNDEHSYGASGYRGRRVYETWMQHRAWIDQALQTASAETDRALNAIVSHIPAQVESLVAFNPTAQKRFELITLNNRYACYAELPPFGYRVLVQPDFMPSVCRFSRTNTPPVIENDFYKITFSADGAMSSIFDRKLNRELLDTTASCAANQFLYTQDNHQTYRPLPQALFAVGSCEDYTIVSAHYDDPVSGASVIQQVTLPNFDRRIDITNTLNHVTDMVNDNRYHRFAYYAFPFSVPQARRLVNVNGIVTEYARDITCHGTDTYLAAHEWLVAENDDFGVALFTLDTQLVEFDHIHPDKTDFGRAGDGSAVFSYFANDWVQMHIPGGGQELNYTLRYSITSYTGSYREAAIPQAAERFANPIMTVAIGKQTGDLPPHQCSFLKLDAPARLLTLKRADDGNGLIARTLGPATTFTSDLPFSFTAATCTTNERPLNAPDASSAEDASPLFRTTRLTAPQLTIAIQPDDDTAPAANAIPTVPAPIGSVYTGLIDAPCAAPGEKPGQLYLLWGQNREPDLAGYRLYRSETEDVDATPQNLVATVEPGPYCVARYEDLGLKPYTWYYYRVCAVSQSGTAGPLSDVFCGLTNP